MTQRQHLIKTTLLAIVLTIVLYTVCFLWLDRPLTLWLTGLHFPPELISICRWIGYYLAPHNAVYLAIALVVIAIIAYPTGLLTRQRQSILSLGISLILALVVAGCLKVLLGRARPDLLIRSHQYGFHWFSAHKAFHGSPSGHATVFFTLATSLTLWIRCRLWTFVLIILALLLSLTRLIIFKHYLGDIVLGAYVGMLSALWGQDIVIRARKILDRIAK